MTSRRAENPFRPQQSTDWIVRAENTSDGSIWPLYVGVKGGGGRIEDEAELDS